MSKKAQHAAPIIKYATVTVEPRKKDLVAEVARRDAGIQEAVQAIRDSSKLGVQESFSYEEVAQLLSVSKRQVQEWVASGDLKTLALPGTERLRRVSRDMLKTFVRTAELRVGFRPPKGLDV
jgi:excisionase family DNA binding protein